MNRIVKLISGKVAAGGIPPGNRAGKADVGGSAFNLLLQRAGVASPAKAAKSDASIPSRVGQAAESDEAGEVRGGNVRGAEQFTMDGRQVATAVRGHSHRLAIMRAQPDGRDSAAEVGEPADGGEAGDGAKSDTTDVMDAASSACSTFAFLANPRVTNAEALQAKSEDTAVLPARAVTHLLRAATREPSPVGLTTERERDAVGERAFEQPGEGMTGEPVVARPVTLRAALPIQELPGDGVAAGPTVVATVIARETHFVPPVIAAPPPLERSVRASRSDDAASESREETLPASKSSTDPRQPGRIRVDFTPETTARERRPIGDTAGKVGEASPSPGVQAGGGLPPAVLQDIGTAIADAADGVSPVEVSGRAALPAATASVAAAPEPVRSLEIRLDIPDHGALNVRMTLNGRALALHLRAEHEDTVHRLRNDRGELADILGRAGFDADVVTVQSQPPDAQGQGGSPTGGQQSGGHNGSAAQGQSGREQRQAGDPSFGADAGRQPNFLSPDSDDPIPPRDRASAGLYV